MSPKIFLLTCLLAMTTLLSGQPTGQNIIDNSIKFHDPTGNWDRFDHRLNFNQQRPGKEMTKRKVYLNNKKKEFQFWAQYDEGLLSYTVKNNSGSYSWNGSSDVPQDLAKKYRIDNTRAVMYRDYYSYLYGMPMKLKDASAIIHPEASIVDFYGEKYYKVKITYNPAAGDDIWYFYFDPETYALEAYQFFHDESKNDGEYILFEELHEVDKIKMPRIRKWYYNKDEKYIASDILIK